MWTPYTYRARRRSAARRSRLRSNCRSSAPIGWSCLSSVDFFLMKIRFWNLKNGRNSRRYSISVYTSLRRRIALGNRGFEQTKRFNINCVFHYWRAGCLRTSASERLAGRTQISNSRGLRRRRRPPFEPRPSVRWGELTAWRSYIKIRIISNSILSSLTMSVYRYLICYTDNLQ